MALSPGDKLGPYEILSQLGAGGMGEVYKARDLRLDRTVAIKTSKLQFSERFEREAQAVAALNHPNICILHDVGPNYLVMELVDGQPLKGPLPIDKVLQYAAQICDALSAAHQKGITHRDLKPANILVTKQGIKLLDFGLAKRVESKPVSEETVTSALTGEGVVLGTPQYMAPEQIEGREADARSDIFAFGCVLYELVTGKKAFEGKTASSIAAAILARDPEPISNLQPLTPASLERVIQACLAKDPDERWQSARDVKIALKEATTAATQASAQSSSRPWQLVAAVCALLAVAAIFAMFQKEDSFGPLGRFQINENVFDGQRFDTPDSLISPDGRTLAFLSNRAAGRRQIFLRPLDSLTTIPLNATEGVNFFFWSPDSKFIGFLYDKKIQKLAVATGAVTTAAEATVRNVIWLANDTLVFESANPGPLMKVGANGGTPEPVTALAQQPRELRHGNIAPCGSEGRFLYTATLDDGKMIWRIGSIQGEKPVSLNAVPEWAACSVVERGRNKGIYLISFVGTTIEARRLDLNSGELSGPSIPLADLKQRSQVGSPVGKFSVSNTGVLIYRLPEGLVSRLAWHDRQGNLLKELKETSGLNPALSPDQTRLAFARGTATWVTDLSRDVSMRITSGIENQFCALPAWSPDGKRIACGSSDGIREVDSNGSGEMRLVTKSFQSWIQHYSPDGKNILYVDPGLKSLMSVAVNGQEPPVEVAPPGQTYFPASYSPDGRFISYASSESGRLEVYVRAVAPATGKWLVSSQGGGMPAWRADGKELFYLSNDMEMMAVDVELQPTFRPSAPHALFKARVSGNNNRRNNFVVTKDGQRFLLSSTTTDSTPINVVLNWPTLIDTAPKE